MTEGNKGEPSEFDPEELRRQLADMGSPLTPNVVRRGMFASLEEAIALAQMETPPCYVAMGPEGGYSLVALDWLPLGNDETDDDAIWHYEEVVVFVPPQYAPEPSIDAFRRGAIGSFFRMTRGSDAP